MKNNVKRNRRPGFTLVELLIVIIIIGILAGGMLLVAGGGTDKANATKIVSDLRNLKSAALMYYADNNKWPATGAASDTLGSYMDRSVSTDYRTYADPVSGDYVGYNGALLTSGVKTKLGLVAKESGLYQGNATAPSTAEYTDGASVWMRVR